MSRGRPLAYPLSHPEMFRFAVRRPHRATPMNTVDIVLTPEGFCPLSTRLQSGESLLRNPRFLPRRHCRHLVRRVFGGLAAEYTHHILRASLSNVEPSLGRGPADVRRHHDRFLGEDRMIRWRWLGRQHIDTGALKLAGMHCRD